MGDLCIGFGEGRTEHEREEERALPLFCEGRKNEWKKVMFSLNTPLVQLPLYP